MSIPWQLDPYLEFHTPSHQDHLSTILEDMEGLQQQCGALSDLVFNLIAHTQNK